MQAALRLLAILLVGFLLTAPARAAEVPVADDRWLWLPRRNPAVAASLSLAWNGTGQLYNGDTEKGLGMMAGWLAFPLAFGIDSLTGGSWLRLFAFGANAGIKVWSVTDAWSGASVAAPPGDIKPATP
ncbi:MAG: hypothetical protein VKS61_15295 [Candidatus Sericytochromatia bacterium]|nr:hypothetical protein [Candidatus Sericytochromatia bacterium]